MSHITDVKMRVRDLDALDEACQALGLELRRGQKSFAWWGRFLGDSNQYGELDPKTFGQCEHAIREKGTNPMNGPGGPWEIGVVAAKNGDGFVVGFDTFGTAGGRLSRIVGLGANKLKQEYSAALAMKRAKKLARQGFVAKRENVADGRIRIKLVRR